MRSRIAPWFLAPAAALALSGCAGVADHRGAASTGAHAPSLVSGATTPLALHKGMKPEEVRRLLGNPESISRESAPAGTAEQWVYTRGQKTEVKQVVTGSKDVPYFDPFINQIRMIPEPTYADEATTITEELHLFWHNGELVDWKIDYRGERSYTK